MRCGFLFLGINLCMYENGGVGLKKKERKKKKEEEEQKKKKKMLEWVWRRKKNKEENEGKKKALEWVWRRKKERKGKKKKKKKKERRRRKCRWWCDNALAKGPTETAYLRDCHWVTDHEFWKQFKCVFIFPLYHTFFWVTESPKLNHQTWVMESKQDVFHGPHQFWIMSNKNRIVSLKTHYIQTCSKNPHNKWENIFEYLGFFCWWRMPSLVLMIAYNTPNINHWMWTTAPKNKNKNHFWSSYWAFLLMDVWIIPR